MQTGVIKWFSERRGYGFITGSDGREYFAHYKDFLCPHTGSLRLRPGDPVAFIPVRDQGKYHAEDVKII